MKPAQVSFFEARKALNSGSGSDKPESDKELG